MSFTISQPLQIILGAVFALIVSALAYRFRLLTWSGALAAFFMGWVIFGLGGLPWAVVLIAFFVSSSGLSLLFKKRKTQAEAMYAKGGTRDHAQVLANGGVASLFVIVHFVFPDQAVGWVGFCAALAAATADTWATELGIFNRGKPVMINSGEAAEAGTSGAISLVGTLSATAGAALIAVLGWGLNPLSGSVVLVPLLLLTGIFGSLVDSLLGATLQGIYFCSACGKETEKTPLHGCGTATTLIRGKAWMNNDWVNTFCTLSASLVAILAGVIFRIF